MFFDKTASDLQHNNMVSITYPNHLKLQINYSVAYMPEKKNDDGQFKFQIILILQSPLRQQNLLKKVPACAESFAEVFRLVRSSRPAC